MNIYLEKLFTKFEISPKDKYEIRQIFSFLPVYKKKNLLDNFESLISYLKISRESMINEQEILLGKVISNIQDELMQIWKNSLKVKVKEALWTIKN